MKQSEIKDYIKYFTNTDLDVFFGEQPTDAQLYTLINWAIRAFSSITWCNYDDRITLTLTANQPTYNLRSPAVVSRKVIYPRRVTIDKNMLLAPDGRPGLWSLADLERWCPGYQNYSSGTPTKAVFLPNYRLLLSPPPDSATAAKTHYISGVYLAADMATDGSDANNSPDIPEEWHETLAYFAAVKAAEPSATESSALMRLKMYNEEWASRLNEYARTNRNLIIGHSFIRGTNNAPLFI